MIQANNGWDFGEPSLWGYITAFWVMGGNRAVRQELLFISVSRGRSLPGHQKEQIMLDSQHFYCLASKHTFCVGKAKLMAKHSQAHASGWDFKPGKSWTFREIFSWWLLWTRVHWGESELYQRKRDVQRWQGQQQGVSSWGAAQFWADFWHGGVSFTSLLFLFKPRFPFFPVGVSFQALLEQIPFLG